MIIVGHRGAAGSAPENTQAGIVEAKRQGCQWIEVDTQLSLDHKAVIFHDATIDRCSNGQGSLLSHSFQNLSDLDFGTWFSKDYKGEKLLTLSQCLNLCMRLNLKLNLELKLAPGQDRQRLVEVVLSTLDHCRFACDDLLISSFDHQLLKLCQSGAPHFRYGHLFEDLPDNWQVMCEAVKAKACHCDIDSLNYEQAQAIKQAGYQLNVYTANQVEQIAAIRDLVDMVITDYPSRFMN